LGAAGSDVGVFDDVARGVDCGRAWVWGVIIVAVVGVCAGGDGG
jgi:hypothetical protein